MDSGDHYVLQVVRRKILYTVRAPGKAVQCVIMENDKVSIQIGADIELHAEPVLCRRIKGRHRILRCFASGPQASMCVGEVRERECLCHLVGNLEDAIDFHGDAQRQFGT